MLFDNKFHVSSFSAFLFSFQPIISGWRYVSLFRSTLRLEKYNSLPLHMGQLE